MGVSVQKFTASLKGTENEVWGVHLQTKFANQSRPLAEWHALLSSERNVPVVTARPQPMRGSPIGRPSPQAVRNGPFHMHALRSGRRR